MDINFGDEPTVSCVGDDQIQDQDLELEYVRQITRDNI